MVGQNVRAAGPVLLCALGPALLSGQEPRARLKPALPGRAAPTQPAPAPAAPSAPTEPAGAAANTGRPPLAGCSPAVRTWWKQTVGTGKHGRIVCAQDPTRPAILLFHGNHQDGRTWTAPSYTEYAYDYKNHPGKKRIGDTHALGNAGVYKVSTSSWLYGKESDRAAWDKANNWFDFLVDKGFTVATWSKNMMTVSHAMPSAREAFDSFLTHTAAQKSCRTATGGADRPQPGGSWSGRSLKTRAA